MEERSRPRIDIVGLGPAGPDLVTTGTMRLIDEIPHRFVRTNRHASASAVDGQSFDHRYEQHESFDDVYQAIVEDLVSAATQYGRVLYAVPGSPRVAEHTVDLLAERNDLDVVVHGALSFVDLTWTELGIDPVDAGVRVIDGHRFIEEAAGHHGPLLVAQCHSREILSDIKLSIDDADDCRVVVLQRLGGPDQSIREIAWHELDREIDADHLTSLYIRELPASVGVAFSQFDVMVKRLREQCPWDAEQTHASLRRYLLEESYETLEALDQLSDALGDASADADVELDARYGDVQEELGDLLYQIFFHSILATEAGWFTVADVAQGIHDKLYERHPHVYGDVTATLDDLPAQWEQQKRQEKGRGSVMDGIPAALPALLYATKVQKKALAIGQSAPPSLDSGATTEAELGQLLFSVVALARELGIDAESALRQHASGFAEHARTVEATQSEPSR